MTALVDIIREADQLLEEGNFSAARDLYRVAATIDSPTKYVLDSLRVAEEAEALVFSRNLREKYPHSIIAWINDISNLIYHGKQWNAHAVQHSTELLQHGNLSGDEALHIRRLRCRAILHSGYYTVLQLYPILVEDFSTIWKAGISEPLTVRGPRGLLDELAAIRDPRIVFVLEALNQIADLPPKVKQFLDLKIQELQTLGEISADYGAPLKDEFGEESIAE